MAAGVTTASALESRARPSFGRADGAAVVLVGTSAVLVAVATSNSDRPTVAVVWGGLALATYAGSLLCGIGGRVGRDLGLAHWRIGSWTLLWFGLAFGLVTILWSRPQLGIAAQINVRYVLRALWLVGVGMTAWTIGYVIGPSQMARRAGTRFVDALTRRYESDVRGRSAPWVLYAVGMVARLASVASTGRFGYVGDAASAVSTATSYGQILSLLSLCAPLAVSAGALQVYRERVPGARITLAVLFLTELAFGAAAGGKQSFLIAVLAVAIPFTVSRKRVPKAALALVAIAFLTLVVPFNQAYRDAARDGTTTLKVGEAVRDIPSIFSNTFDHSDVVETAASSLYYLMLRSQEIETPAIILQRTPSQIPFVGAVQLVESPAVELIPRAFWPSKPIIAVGYEISQKYYGFSSSVYTSSAVTPFGDLYRYDGWMALLVGMLLLGCGVRLLDQVLDVRNNPHAIFMVLLLFPSLVKSELDWASLVASIPSTIIIWIVAVALTFRRRRYL